MSSIASGIADIIKSLLEIPLEIVKGIGEFFEELFAYLNPFSEDFILKTLLENFTTLLDYLNPFSENFILKILFNWIADLIELVFIPDTEKLKEDFDTMLSSVSSSFGISFDSLENFKDTWQEKPVENVSADYNIYGVGTLNLSFLDTSYLVQGVERFRPIIRGFVVFLLLLYNYYQALTFIGQDPRIAHNAERAAEEHIRKGEKK